MLPRPGSSRIAPAHARRAERKLAALPYFAAFFSRFSAFFSLAVLAGCFFVSFFWFMPLLIALPLVLMDVATCIPRRAYGRGTRRA